MISCSSSLASSTPATSLKVTFFCCVECRRARLLPKLRALLPPLCIWRIMKIQKADQQDERRGVEQDGNPSGAAGFLDVDLDLLCPEEPFEGGIKWAGMGVKNPARWPF